MRTVSSVWRPVVGFGGVVVGEHEMPAMAAMTPESM